MTYSITQLKEDLAGSLQGTTLNKVTNLTNLIDRAARQLLIDCDPPETVREVQITNGIFDNIYDYTCPSDLKGHSIIDIRPQGKRLPSDITAQGYSRQFDAVKDVTVANQMTVEYLNGYKVLRLNKNNLPAEVSVNPLNNITNNGTWSAGGTASNLSTDSIYFQYQTASLKFDVASGSGSQTGYIQNSTFTPIDLSNFVNTSSFFVWAYITNPTPINSINLQWGSSASDYYSVSATTAFDGTAFVEGWNLIQFEWATPTQTGTPVNTAIDYLRLGVTYTTTGQVNIRFCNLTIQNQVIYNVLYYSEAMFRNATTGAFLSSIDDDTNLINLATDSYNLLIDLVCAMSFDQIESDKTSKNSNKYLLRYKENLLTYKRKYKSYSTKPQSVYYPLQRRRFYRTSGRNWN